MGYSVKVAPKGGYLRVTVTGKNTAENVRACLSDVYEACAESGVANVFIEENLRGPALDPVQVYRIILDSSPRTAPIIRRIAYVDLNPEHPSTNIELGEAVARDQGVNVRVFPTLDLAESWMKDLSGV
jgi:hypothetical protein